jgi:hypothetical protein
MAIEILSFTVKPEISIGDIAAIGALIASPLIFWFGYARTRKSEQIKIAREIMDRIDTKRQKLDQLPVLDMQGVVRGVPNTAEWYEQEIAVFKAIDDIVKAIPDLFLEIEYFGYLLKTHEIEDENLLRYCIPKLAVAFLLMKEHLGALKGLDKPFSTKIDSLSFSIWDRLNEVKDTMKVWLDKYSPGTTKQFETLESGFRSQSKK